MNCEEHLARIGEMRNAHKILVGKPQGKNQMGDISVREDNIKIYLRKIGREFVGGSSGGLL
jgi:hypothetical protein